MNQLTKNMMKFIGDSPTAFHAVENMAKELLEEGYIELFEKEQWKVKFGGKYFVRRNKSSIIEINLGKNKKGGLEFHITGTHSDSPSFKLKEKVEYVSGKKYTRLNVEGYGGMIMSTWFDRPLSIAGRVFVKEKKGSLKQVLINIDRDLIMIPNVAIHMDRSINDGYKYNAQTDMMPLFSQVVKEGSFDKFLASELNVSEKDIVGKDLYLYNRQAPSNWGENKEFISAPRIDNLECAYAGHKGIIDSDPAAGVIDIHACFDNEEVGSSTKQGAASTFLSDTMERIGICLGLSREQYLNAVASSFLLSADNGHAVHPNHPEHTDNVNAVYMNEGVVIKSQASGRYISDGMSIAIIKSVAEGAKVPVQYYSNRSDKPGGSTLGNIALSHTSIPSVDIGLAMLAMHSSYETAGIKDADYMYNLMKGYYTKTLPVVN